MKTEMKRTIIQNHDLTIEEHCVSNKKINLCVHFCAHRVKCI